MTSASKQEHAQGLTVTEHQEDPPNLPDKIIIVSHSMMFYWWPVWVVGFVMAAITFFSGSSIYLGVNPAEKIHPNSGLGFVYICVLFACLLVTNITLRGLAAGIAIMAGLFFAVLFAWLGWWDNILRAIPEMTVHMNFGFYMLSSTFVFILWALTFFVFDRLSYWRVVPGQVTQEHLIGGGEQSYDTGGLVFEEFHDDPFRHYILGFGTGDLKMTVRGAKTDEFYLSNVLFANSKVTQIQKLIKIKPD